MSSQVGFQTPLYTGLPDTYDLTTFMAITNWKVFNLPSQVTEILDRAPSVKWLTRKEELFDLSCGTAGNVFFEVSYILPDRRRVVEATVARVRNGLAANYVEPYMRRREPDCLFIADDRPTDRLRFHERFNYRFDSLKDETYEWLKKEDLVVHAFLAGHDDYGIPAMLIAPRNAAFFSGGLALLQGMLDETQLKDGFSPRVVIYVAPPFRHTHFKGKQVVVHNRGESLYEMFSYNLYPGPSAKKGVYGVLIDAGEREGWICPHCSTVQVVTPYDNITTIMHEGASGGGKSEMLEQIHREADGRLLLGRNVVTKETRHLEVPRACGLKPVTDDIAMCHPSIQKSDGRLRVQDAENAWFVRVNHIREYGTDPYLEKLTAQPPENLLFLNVDAVPGSRALIWEHVDDAPGVPCPNPRVIVPRAIAPGVVSEPVAIDIRSYGVRTPPCTSEKPSYGILGLFHVLPPALAWLWRLAAPRGHANPSILDSEGMSSEGVGSYWPFMPGKKVAQANLLLRQFASSTAVRHVLIPNQHVGAWETGFMPQWIAREYLARRGNARFTPDQIQPARCPLLGYALYQLRVEGQSIPRWFLQVNTQPEVGVEAYDQGAEILFQFFRREIELYLTPDLDDLGRRIIECCFSRGNVSDYEDLIPSV